MKKSIYLSTFLAILAITVSLIVPQHVNAGGMCTNVTCTGEETYCVCSPSGGKPDPYQQVIPEPGLGGGNCIATGEESAAIERCMDGCHNCSFEGCCTGNGGEYIP